MHSISIAKLKATLSAELKRVRAGESVTVLDRSTPIAMITPLPEEIKIVKAAGKPYLFRELRPLTSLDPLVYLAKERGESW